MNAGSWGRLAVLAIGILSLAACDGSSRNPFNRDAANPQAANRQQCIDKGDETGSVQYQQCVTQGRGLEN